MKEKFERIIKFSLPYDKRTEDPNTSYGIGAMRIWFILKGKKGAVQIVMGTEFYLPRTVHEYLNSNNPYWKNLMTESDGSDKKPFKCWDVGFHSKKRPDYMDTSNKQECNILGKCYYDGSSLRGDNDKVDEIFMEEGEEGILKYLEKYYQEIIGEPSQKCPKKSEEKKDE